MWNNYCLILVFSFFCSLELSAQEEVDNQTWSDITFMYYFSPKFSTGGDIGLRGIISGESWNQFYVRPNIRYRFTPWFNLTGGVGSFNTFESDVTNTYEFRLFQDANFRWPDFGPVEMFHRIRFEQRWFFYSEESIDNVFSSRGRYLLGIETIDFRLFSNRAQFYFKSMIEFFLQVGESSLERFVNQNRIHLGFGHRINRKWRYEVQYFRQGSRRNTEEGFKTSENIFRLRIFHSFNIIDPKPQLVPAEKGGFY